MLPGGGYSTHAPHEAEPIVEWLEGLGVRASAFRYPLHARHPVPLEALRREIRRRRDGGADRIGIAGFSAGGHLAGLAALAPSSDEHETVDFVVMGYAITSMETETYRPSQVILLGEHPTPQLRRETSLDALVTPSAPPFFIWHTAEDSYVPPEHTYRLARALAANDVAHTVHVFAHGPHSLGLARGAGDAEIWTTLAASWIAERIAPNVAQAMLGTRSAAPRSGGRQAKVDRELDGARSGTEDARGTEVGEEPAHGPVRRDRPGRPAVVRDFWSYAALSLP